MPIEKILGTTFHHSKWGKFKIRNFDVTDKNPRCGTVFFKLRHGTLWFSMPFPLPK